MEAQGYTLNNKLLYQDNKLISTILLPENGLMSAGKVSRHICCQFFSVRDKIVKEDVQGLRLLPMRSPKKN